MMVFSISLAFYSKLSRESLSNVQTFGRVSFNYLPNSPKVYHYQTKHSSVTTLLLITGQPPIKYVTQSGKTGLIAYLKVSRNTGFKYLVCCSSQMVEAMCTKFSHVLYQFLTFHSIHCASSQQLSFLPF